MNTRTLVSKFNIGFITSSSIIFAGAFVVNVLNYVFTLVISRLVGVAAFGEVTALFSLLLIVSVPAAALSMLMTREAAAQNMFGPGAVRELFDRLQKNVLMVSGGFWVLFLAMVPRASRVFHAVQAKCTQYCRQIGCIYCTRHARILGHRGDTRKCNTPSGHTWSVVTLL